MDPVILTLSNMMISNTLSNMLHNIRDITKCLKNMNTYDSEKITNHLEMLDIYATMAVIENLLKTNNNEHNETIKICMNNLREIINDILVEIKELNKILNYNNSLWFLQAYRSKNYDRHMNTLDILKKKMDNRIELFIKVKSLY